MGATSLTKRHMVARAVSACQKAVIVCMRFVVSPRILEFFTTTPILPLENYSLPVLSRLFPSQPCASWSLSFLSHHLKPCFHTRTVYIGLDLLPSQCILWCLNLLSGVPILHLRSVLSPLCLWSFNMQEAAKLSQVLPLPSPFFHVLQLLGVMIDAVPIMCG